MGTPKTEVPEGRDGAEEVGRDGEGGKVGRARRHPPPGRGTTPRRGDRRDDLGEGGSRSLRPERVFVGPGNKSFTLPGYLSKGF